MLVRSYYIAGLISEEGAPHCADIGSQHDSGSAIQKASEFAALASSATGGGGTVAPQSAKHRLYVPQQPLQKQTVARVKLVEHVTLT